MRREMRENRGGLNDRSSKEKGRCGSISYTNEEACAIDRDLYT